MEYMFRLRPPHKIKRYMKKVVLSVVLLLIGFFIGYFCSGRFPLFSKFFPEQLNIYLDEFPQCDSGHCPHFVSVDVDGDDLSESVLYIPYGMTRGVADVWIIDEGKIVLKAGGGQGCSYEVNDDNKGITVSVISKYDANGIDPLEREYDKYIYEDGKYVLKETYTLPVEPGFPTTNEGGLLLIDKFEEYQKNEDPKDIQSYYDAYEDPFVIHLRKALNGYLDGSNYGMSEPKLVVESGESDNYLEGLSSFSKSYYQSKFIVYYLDDSIAGGKDIQIIFQDKPDKLFRAWVYRLSSGKYDLRGFSQDLRYTPEKIIQIQVGYKEFLEDKNHAI